MKRIVMIMLSFGLISGAFAQHRLGGGYYRGGGTRVIVSAGAYYPFYNGFGFGVPFGYGGYYGYPSYGGGYGYRPSKLDLQIEDIKHDYQEKISAARDDDSLNGKERRSEVRSLKKERDDAITQAKRDYYKRK